MHNIFQTVAIGIALFAWPAWSATMPDHGAKALYAVKTPLLGNPSISIPGAIKSVWSSPRGETET